MKIPERFEDMVSILAKRFAESNSLGQDAVFLLESIGCNEVGFLIENKRIVSFRTRTIKSACGMAVKYKDPLEALKIIDRVLSEYFIKGNSKVEYAEILESFATAYYIRRGSLYVENLESMLWSSLGMTGL